MMLLCENEAVKICYGMQKGRSRFTHFAVTNLNGMRFFLSRYNWSNYGIQTAIVSKVY